ncbi:MAG: hypothetical protein MUE75_06290 [Algoriphagus sp.]|jgi:hypothetical protein|nr:hypothetical protein [Algoriphagus sp.]
MLKIVFFLSSVFFFLSNGISAQVAGENLPYIPAYREQIPYFQELITGGQFAEPSPLIKGEPYYGSRQFEPGILRINGITYPEVPLVYDCYRDQLVTFHPIFNQKILIKPEKIDGFSLSNGDLFRHFSGNESYSRHGNGIYQVVGEGKAIALAKRYKTTKSLREMSRFDEEYLEKVDFIILNDGVFTEVKKASDVYLALGLEPKVLKKELKAKGLQFKPNPEGFLSFLVSHPALD